MAPIEFEKQIKERMEEREIKPSADAWDNIKNKIDIPPKQKKSGFVRYAVAASIIGILFTVVWMANQADDQSLEQFPIVDNQSENKEESIQEDVTIPVQESSPTKITKTDVAGNEVFEEQQDVSITTEEQELALEIQQAKPEGEPLDLQTELRIDQKIAEVVAQVKILEDNKEAVTDAEVESLLKNAQEELMAERAEQNAQGVDATALLAGVEDELNKSFRDQVFERLKNGFVKVRTAVADRNN